jgi:transcriptional regulator with XRE-family HTH domain
METVPNERFRAARRRQRLAQMALAIRAGTAVGIISMIEEHGYRPGPDLRKRLSSALEVPAAELWPGAGDGRSP